ncbi:MAG: glycosyltransferase family 4 protein [DPANN group archaeon]|nr:glycosyltransferase family 4 protein [DPANN group archaeon]
MFETNLKIAIIGWGFPPKIEGGLDIHVYETAIRFAKLGYVIHLFLPDFNCPKYKNQKLPQNLVIHPIMINPKITDINILIKTVEQYNLKIISELKNLDFDMIHTHDWFGVDSGVWVKNNLKKPWITTFHSLEYMRSTIQDDSSLISLFEKKAIATSDVLITVSNFMVSEIKTFYNIKKQMFVVYNSGSINQDDYKKTFEKKDTNTKNILYIGRLASQKGIEYFLTAIKEVIKTEKCVKCIIVGSGYMSESLKKHAKNLGIENNVFFEGFVKSETLSDYYQNADIFISPSIYEPFGITIVDAMRIGIPVIATDKTGAVESLINGKDYIKVKTRSSDEISSAITRLLSDDILRKSIGSNGKKAVEMYSWDKCAKELSDIYHSTNY